MGRNEIPPSQRLLRQDEALRDGLIHRRDRVPAAGINYEERLTEMEPARIRSPTGLNDVVEQRRAIGSYKQNSPSTGARWEPPVCIFIHPRITFRGFASLQHKIELAVGISIRN